ncbi:efflux RND transporter periplasmic adaptor subunit [Metapseudomonas resinovorans]|uniref:Putative membrane fusion protein n=1 Tax=Metapseudomonas resinovorans NBRC 106553 TaxID=1245471 RepID=S6AIR5_METRE|nr:efflux RND transporter periplasmic adaptor subunit [Pseudomonas resinovorans]BAN48320.1 putative membrane fusion protein [Pseudomonas resinovorans NBRC 106553]
MKATQSGTLVLALTLTLQCSPLAVTRVLAQDAPLVAVEAVPIKDTAQSHEFVGRVEAVNAVDILARVDGFLDGRLFNEGDAVQRGQELFAIERKTYEIALTEAQAALASARAVALDAERELQRNQTLVRRQNVAQAVLEQSETARDSARASVMAAEARVSQAELNLSYTHIKAPIDGRIGTATFSVGSLVGPSSGPLARVVQSDPIRVVFSVSDRTILDLRAAAGGLTKDQLAKRFSTAVRLSNGQQLDQAGAIDFFNNEIDPLTGTLAIRTLVANPQALLLPGQFVTVVVRDIDQKLRPVVPLGAVQQDREGKFVLLVDYASKVAVRRIGVSTQVAGGWVVDDGLEGGEKLIVEGFQNAAPGTLVKVTEVGTDDPAGAAQSGKAP